LTCVNTSDILTASSTTTGATYNWGAGITTATNTVTVPATYTVTATAPANGCTATASTNVIQNIIAPNANIAPPVVLTCSVTSETLTASSTTTGVGYNWGNGIFTNTNNISNPGTYTVTVTDITNGCTSSASALVTRTGVPPTASIASPTLITCANPTETLTASSTTNNATYSWGVGANSASYSISVAGTYTVTVTDPSNGCTTSAAVSVSQNINAPDASVSTPPNLTCAVTNVTITAVSNTPGATFNWGSGNTSSTVSESVPGNYTVTITDPSNGCITLATAAVTQNLTAPNLFIAQPASLTCIVNSVTLIASSTTTGTTFNWGGGITTPAYTVSAIGNYIVTATNPQTECTATASAVVNRIGSPSIGVTNTDVSCNGGNNGTITVNVTGGVAPYQFAWSNNATSGSLSGLQAGMYVVTVTDAIGCTVSESKMIGQPSALHITVSHTDVSCNGLSDGNIAASVTGGVSPYSYAWSNGSTTAGITGINAGQYELTITDNNQCTADQITSILQPSLLELTASTTNTSCFGTNDGTVQLTANGGTPAYTFSWNDGSINQNRTSLSAGNYSVTITDQHQCKTALQITITQPEAINLTSQIIQPTCPQNGHDGSISLVATGGDSVYHFRWSTGEQINQLTHLQTGTYQVTATDTKGCSVTESFTLNYLYNFVIHASQSVSINLGQSTELSYSVDGNAGNISSNIWSPGYGLSCTECLNPTASPNVSTIYQITVMNQAGCPATDTVIVNIVPDYSIFIPNAFTPNGDGKDDYFQIYGNLQGVEYVDAQIFNRWGEKVFESHDINFRWDGSFKGAIQDPQVYVYQIKFAFMDGHVEPLRKGSITLLR